MATRWVVAGGGTGGHVTPALALGEAIADRGEEVLFIGSARGLEAKLVPEAGFELECLPSQQVMGRGLAGRARGAAAILASVPAARRAIRRSGAQGVLSVGGYAAMPAALAARSLGRPLFLIEPNAIPGRVNRLSARFADTIFLGFESARDAFPARARTAALGVPLRRALAASFETSQDNHASTRTPRLPLRLMIFGGSQGARQLNEQVPAAIERLAPDAVEIFHQTGEADREEVERAYTAAGRPAEVVAFERDMPARYRWADLAICRAGALTVAELALAGMPALLVPYPFAADDHQTANAKALEAAGAGRCLDPRPLETKALAQSIAEFVHAPGRLVPMQAAARKLARPSAAQDILEACSARLAGSANGGAVSSGTAEAAR